jgi:hypothetical protein
MSFLRDFTSVEDKGPSFVILLNIKRILLLPFLFLLYVLLSCTKTASCSVGTGRYPGFDKNAQYKLATNKIKQR